LNQAPSCGTRESQMSPDQSALPRHVAIIMDGNGRWAQLRGLPRIEGHRRGAVAVREVVRAAREVGVKALTLYAFSAQNWLRPPGEVAMLMQLLRDYVIDERPEILDNDIRLITIGNVGRLPSYVREPLEALKQDSTNNKKMTLCLALSYGGRESIVATTRALCDKVLRKIG
jgi:undecaprenyl diphosphate synthase